MIDKDTQVDIEENCRVVICKPIIRQRVRKSSVALIPTSFCFKLENRNSFIAQHHRLPSRCNSKKDLRHVMKRNISEFNIRPATTKTTNVITLTFNHIVPNMSRKILR